MVPAFFVPFSVQGTFDEQQSCLYILSLKLFHSNTDLAYSVLLGPSLPVERELDNRRKLTKGQRRGIRVTEKLAEILHLEMSVGLLRCMWIGDISVSCAWVNTEYQVISSLLSTECITEDWRIGRGKDATRIEINHKEIYKQTSVCGKLLYLRRGVVWPTSLSWVNLDTWGLPEMHTVFLYESLLKNILSLQPWPRATFHESCHYPAEKHMPCHIKLM